MKPQGDPAAFRVGQRVRYKPGGGTYGYEDAVEADGRIAARVLGITRTRVRLQLQATRGVLRRTVVTVDAASLEAVPEATTATFPEFDARGARARDAQHAAEQVAAHGPGLTFGELAIGELFYWPAPIPIGPEAMVKTSATRYEWSRGTGTAEDFYRVERSR